MIAFFSPEHKSFILQFEGNKLNHISGKELQRSTLSSAFKRGAMKSAQQMNLHFSRPFMRSKSVLTTLKHAKKVETYCTNSAHFFLLPAFSPHQNIQGVLYQMLLKSI
jgi:hypothetical protein